MILFSLSLTTLCSALIEAGVPVDHSGGDYEQTALHYAAREGRKECVQVLLQHGAAYSSYRHAQKHFCISMRLLIRL